MGSGTDGWVGVLTLHPSGELLVGGSFGVAGGYSNARFARWTETNIPWVYPLPAERRLCEQEHNLSLSVDAATGYSNLTFVWLRDGFPIDTTDPRIAIRITAHSSSLTISNATDSDAGQYTVRVSNACGHSTSTPAAVAVCRADVDCNGVTDPTDIAVFVKLWIDSFQHGTLAADFDRNGAVDPADISAFVQSWLAGLQSGC